MKIIIFAGGTGKRFWPLSRKSSPKQFLPVIDNKPLLRLKYEYLRQGFESEDIFISTGKQYEKEVRSIIPELSDSHFIFEPEMRDTGPAVALAVSYIAHHYPDETVSIQWSDHYIKHPEVFISALKEGEQLISPNIQAINIAEKPRFASEHRGYVKYGNRIQSIGNHHVLCEFSRFIEKPTLEVAQEYLESGDYSWNLGYWVIKPTILFDKYRQFAPEILNTVDKMVSSNFTTETVTAFSLLKKISFDYIFAENLNSTEAVVINTDMGWSDIGEWIALKETLACDDNEVVTQGNVVDLGSCDCLLYNTSDKNLLSTINLKGLIVVVTKDVVAIFPKEDNTKLKQYLTVLENQGFSEYL
jgi:mannose-1-phosphate guanylyltransferase